MSAPGRGRRGLRATLQKTTTSWPGPPPSAVPSPARSSPSAGGRPLCVPSTRMAAAQAEGSLERPEMMFYTRSRSQLCLTV